MTFDQKPVPQLTHGLTLNAIVSILATFSKTSLILATSAAISQLKWRWFQDHENSEGRSVLDTQLFDDASRGPWGSLVFVTKGHTSSLASLGAVITILALVFDPFAQQLISYPSHLDALTSSDLASPNVSRAETFLWWDNQNFEFNLRNAIWGGAQADRFLDASPCASENCTWPDFDTLAFCSSCEDRTDDLVLTGCSLSFEYRDIEYGTYTLHEDGIGNPDAVLQLQNYCGLSFKPDNGTFQTYGGSVYGNLANTTGSNDSWIIVPDSLEYEAHIVWPLNEAKNLIPDPYGYNPTLYNGTIPGPIPVLSMAYASLYPDPHGNANKLSVRNASICSITPCVKHHSLSVTNGLVHAKTLSTEYGSFYWNASGYWTVDAGYVPVYPPTTKPASDYSDLAWSLERAKDGRVVVNTDPTLASINSSFSLQVDPLFGLRDTVPKLLGDNITQTIRQDAFYNITAANKTIRFSAEADSSIQGMVSTSSTNDNLQYIVDRGGLPWIIPRLTDSLNRLVRERGNITVVGISYNSRNYVHVRWVWMLLPVLTIALGAAFLLLTMWVFDGKDEVLWKTSGLPLLLYGFEKKEIEEGVGGMVASTEKISEMEEVAKEMRARLKDVKMAGR